MQGTLTGALIVACLASLAQSPSAQSSREASRARSDTAEVRAVYLAGIDAFNQHDLERFSTQFAPDIEMYTPTGWLRGAVAVRERFAQTFRQFPRVRMTIDSLQVRAVAPGAVLVDFRWRVYPMGQGPAYHGVGTGVYVRRDSQWREVLEHETVTRVDPELQGGAPAKAGP
jgi:uncharacterized protein (TIGR02246 family)